MTPAPKFSIVIPAYRRTKQLANLLSSLTCLDYAAHQFEVIVVDDGSPVSLENVVSPFSTVLRITLLEQDNSGPAAARNRGASCARGNLLAFTDDDCLVDAGWLQAMEEAFRETPVTICGGKTFNLLNRNVYSTASQLLLDFLYQHYSPQMYLGGFFPTHNFAVPRGKFLEMGGFDPKHRFGEDRDFCHRWALRGYPFRSVPEAVIYHAHPLGVASFLLLHFWYGQGSYMLRRRCIDRKCAPPKLNPLSFYLKLILSGIKEQRNLHGSLLSLLLLACQGANSAGFFWGALKSELFSRRVSEPPALSTRGATHLRKRSPRGEWLE